MEGLAARDLPRVRLEDAAAGRTPCPVCGEPLFGWLALEPAEGTYRVLERCERCGLGVTLGAAPAVRAELAAIAESAVREEPPRLRFANRASLQASMGGTRWALLHPERDYHLTPDAARRLLREHGAEPLAARPVPGASLAGMWRTGIAALSFGDDRGVRRILNRMILVLAAVPVAAVTTPLELGACAVGRAGVVEIRARRG